MDGATQTGRILGGRYRLGEILGQGGWGAVYAAVQMDLGRPVAIKVLHSSVALSSDGLSRFEREAKAAAALGHPNIAQVSDFAANAGEPPFLVMELLTGATLGAAMKRSTKLPPSRVAWIAYQILAGLEVAHAAGIVHRDIKPDNVFLVAMPGVEDFVKLLDFGIAKLAGDSNHHLTTTGTMLGSPAFMAPEQVRSNDVDHRVDIYALGATMYLALSGRMPFDAATLHALLLAITEQRCVPLSVLDPSIDPALSAVVERAMHKDPNGRYPTAAAMRVALEPWLGGMAAHASATANAPRPFPLTTAASLLPYGMPNQGTANQVMPNQVMPNQAMPSHGISNHAISNQGMAMTPAFMASAAPPPAKGGGAIIALLAAVVVLLLLIGSGAAYYVYSRGASDRKDATGAGASASGAAAAGAAAPGGAAPPASVATTGGAAATPVAAGGAGAKGRAAGAAPASGGGAAAAAGGATPGAAALAAGDAGATAAPAAGGKKQFAGTSFRIGGGQFESFDIEASKAAIMARSGAIGGCYAATEFDPPDHQFTDWTFQVDAAGAVKSVGRTTSFEPHPKFDACMISALRQVRWPSSKAGGSPHVSFTARTRDNP